MKTFFFVMAIAVVRTVFAQTPVLVLCPYTIAGRVVNFDGIAFYENSCQ